MGIRLFCPECGSDNMKMLPDVEFNLNHIIYFECNNCLRVFDNIHAIFKEEENNG